MDDDQYAEVLNLRRLLSAAWAETERLRGQVQAEEITRLREEYATVLAERDAAVAMGTQLQRTATRLRDALVEWRRTPFFKTKERWQEWIDDFGERVDALLRETR